MNYFSVFLLRFQYKNQEMYKTFSPYFIKSHIYFRNRQPVTYEHFTSVLKLNNVDDYLKILFQSPLATDLWQFTTYDISSI